jgi:lysyl endopeptidase
MEADTVGILAAILIASNVMWVDVVRFKAMSRGLFLVAVTLIAVFPCVGLGKMYEQPKSTSLTDRSLQNVDRKVLEQIDRERLLAEDRKPGRSPQRPGPLRFAITEDVDFTVDNSGTWRDLEDGRLWRLIIQSPQAVSQNLGFTRFDMPQGSKLWIYDPEQKRVEGPYTAQHRSRHGRLWTPIIEGDEIVVEIFVPKGLPNPAIVIGKVNKGYRVLGKGGAEKSHGACNNDVICPEGDPWRDQIRSVARYSIGGTSLCTGQLLNNTSLDFTPYFLSANHCNVSAANDDTLVFYWNFQSPNCGDQGGGSLADNQTGAIFRAASAPSDFVLVELATDPDPAFNVFFSGWDASGTAPSSTVAIHHPSGDVKSISFNNNAVTSTAYLSNTVSATANHWRVDQWEDGTTEGGSSGSCIWNTANKRCVGQLHGGYASCSSSTSDWYGKLSVSWDGGGTAATRLRDWLDPANSGTLSLNGDPHIVTLDGTRYDFQGAGEFIALRDVGGAEIQVRQAAIATTFNPGPDPYHGLSTCVSLNTAVAARVGKQRVTYQPNISGVPDPSGLQLRVDGQLTTLGPSGLDLAGGGRMAPTSAAGGIEISFPENYTLFVTPGWWSSQSKWYLNVGVVRTPALISLAGASPSGASVAAGGLGGVIPRGSWLPPLPDGSSIGSMPSALHDRYVALYERFGAAWRVTDANSLFDYAPGTNTATFTIATWPFENPPCILPQITPVKPLSLAAARDACAAIRDKGTRANCVFDVRVTGERGFARTYLLNERVQAGATTLRLRDSRDPSRHGEQVTFTAVVARKASDLKDVPKGYVRFAVDGVRIGKPIRLDENGRAVLKPTRLAPGRHKVAATFLPDRKSGVLSSASSEEHVVLRKE